MGISKLFILVHGSWLFSYPDTLFMMMMFIALVLIIMRSVSVNLSLIKLIIRRRMSYVNKRMIT